jgi:hypothetical protein
LADQMQIHTPTTGTARNNRLQSLDTATTQT